MNASQILALMNRMPFEPFEIRMSDGGRVVVEHPWEISTKPNSPSCAVYQEESFARIIAYRNITEIVTATPV